jgi:hypothetical protein
VTAKTAVEALIEHWREFGRPAYAQFDNDTIFQGGHHGRDALGRVVRTCLRLDVKVWARFYHDALTDLQERSLRYLRAYHQRAAVCIEAAPQRRPFPARGNRICKRDPTGW